MGGRKRNLKSQQYLRCGIKIGLIPKTLKQARDYALNGYNSGANGDNLFPDKELANKKQMVEVIYTQAEFELGRIKELTERLLKFEKFKLK